MPLAKALGISSDFVPKVLRGGTNRFCPVCKDHSARLVASLLRMIQHVLLNAAHIECLVCKNGLFVFGPSCVPLAISSLKMRNVCLEHI